MELTDPKLVEGVIEELEIGGGFKEGVMCALADVDGRIHGVAIHQMLRALLDKIKGD